jgi:hypothetical protein
MKPQTLQRVHALAEAYFGPATLDRSLAVLERQVFLMRREPTLANVRRQSGDLLFALVHLVQDLGWDLETLLEETATKLEVRRNARHYYEAHLTFEPVFGRRLKELSTVCSQFGFHLATLLMKKRAKATPTRAAEDSFATGRSVSYSELESRMLRLMRIVRNEGFQIWRYKIEETALDSRYDDSKFPLTQEHLPEKERLPRPPADHALSGRKREAED